MSVVKRLLSLRSASCFLVILPLLGPVLAPRSAVAANQQPCLDLNGNGKCGVTEPKLAVSKRKSFVSYSIPRRFQEREATVIVPSGTEFPSLGEINFSFSNPVVVKSNVRWGGKDLSISTEGDFTLEGKHRFLGVGIDVLGKLTIGSNSRIIAARSIALSADQIEVRGGASIISNRGNIESDTPLVVGSAASFNAPLGNILFSSIESSGASFSTGRGGQVSLDGVVNQSNLTAGAISVTGTMLGSSIRGFPADDNGGRTTVSIAAHSCDSRFDQNIDLDKWVTPFLCKESNGTPRYEDDILYDSATRVDLSTVVGQEDLWGYQLSDLTDDLGKAFLAYTDHPVECPSPGSVASRVPRAPRCPKD